MTTTWPAVVNSSAGAAPATAPARRSSHHTARHANPYRSADQAAYATLGVVGELFITVGVALLAFLVWQLWWTDVEGNNRQSHLVNEFQKIAPTPPPNVAVPGEGPPPVMAEPGEAAVTFASIEIPRWNGEPVRPISQGTDRSKVLDPLGIGHYVGTAMPGDVGNFAIAGHRTTFGKPFNRIEELKIGDALVVRTPDTWYVYRVTSFEIVRPSQGNVVAPVPGDPTAEPTQRLITLTTCHPKYSAQQRYIVHGELDYWAPTSSGTPQELLDAKG
ncbi:MAG: class E sortase [Micrococcales bacterium]|nr:class E sortase [Micrococcales bacterium]MCL2667788.1 class E sortase [Micrococcales bacterium]